MITSFERNKYSPLLLDLIEQRTNDFFKASNEFIENVLRTKCNIVGPITKEIVEGKGIEIVYLADSRHFKEFYITQNGERISENFIFD